MSDARMIRATKYENSTLCLTVCNIGLLLFTAVVLAVPCRAQAFEIVSLPSIPECNTGFEGLSFSHSLALENNGQVPTVAVSHIPDICTPRLFEVVSTGTLLPTVLISFPKADELITLS